VPSSCHLINQRCALDLLAKSALPIGKSLHLQPVINT
jgi:hypothetical protein